MLPHLILHILRQNAVKIFHRTVIVLFSQQFTQPLVCDNLMKESSLSIICINGVGQIYNHFPRTGVIPALDITAIFQCTPGQAVRQFVHSPYQTDWSVQLFRQICHSSGDVIPLCYRISKIFHYLCVIGKLLSCYFLLSLL